MSARIRRSILSGFTALVIVLGAGVLVGPVPLVPGTDDVAPTGDGPGVELSAATAVNRVVPTTTVRPPAEHETFVATIVPAVGSIRPLTEPRGDVPVDLEFRVTNPTYFGNPLTLMVTDRTADGQWLKVQIPVRPNGTEGWIPAWQADLSSHFVRAQVDLDERTVRVWDGDDLIAETIAVVGPDRTPTPVGTFFVNDLVEKFDGSSYGPYILSLSAYSEVMETFGGGVPVIAIHGTNRPELMGGAHSNGCIRIPNDVVRFLAETVPMGTPVDIVA